MHLCSKTQDIQMKWQIKHSNVINKNIQKSYYGNEYHKNKLNKNYSEIVSRQKVQYGSLGTGEALTCEVPSVKRIGKKLYKSRSIKYLLSSMPLFYTYW